MPRLPPLPHQFPPRGELPRTNQEVYAEALALAELELVAARAARKNDESEEARSRHAQALQDRDRLAREFSLVAAGLADVNA